MRYFVDFFLCIIFFAFVFQNVLAVDPVSVANNKFGIHIAVPDEKDLEDASQLVNSSGGDWGYVTVVIQENDRDHGKWQGIFDKMRRLHLIPLVRLATKPEGGVWRRPTTNEAQGWAEFLNSLNWVVRNRYVILFNEPNHATEWGGEVNPENYAEIAYEFAAKLKKAHPDFFIMLSGFDQSAPNISPRYLSEEEFLRRMSKKWDAAEWSGFIDGISSHSYPNPGFSGPVEGYGKGTVRGYQWEQQYFRQLGVTKDLPVFITETGWRRGALLNEQQVAERIRDAYENIWLVDSSLAAVTPFVLNYQGEPFLDFSWRKYNGDGFYQQYQAITDLKKASGMPEQITDFTVLTALPKQLVSGSRFEFVTKLRNTGQTIWDESYAFSLISAQDFFYYFSPLPVTYPSQEREVEFYLQTPDQTGVHEVAITVAKGGKVISDQLDWQIRVVPSVDIELRYLLLGLLGRDDNFQVEIYDKRERLVYKQINVHGEKGKIMLKGVRNVALNETYRIVLLKPYYLPRQSFISIQNEGSMVSFKPHLPLDRNQDGKFSLQDIVPL